MIAAGNWQCHPLAGIEFPDSIDDFVRTTVTQYDQLGHDISVGYSWPRDNPDTNLTCFVYPASDASDADQLGQAVRDIYLAHPTAQALSHSRALMNGLEGLRMDFLLPGASPREGSVQSSVVLFNADGWFVKVRATAVTAHPRRDAGHLAEALANQLGGPTTRRRLQAALPVAAADSTAALAELRRASCAEGVEAVDPDGSMRLCLGLLDRGEVLDATELCMSMEAESHPAAALVERVLCAYYPGKIQFRGGVGASLDAPVVVVDANTDDECVAACSRYLECVLGPPVHGWSIQRCEVVLAPDCLLDGIHATGPAGESVAVYFKVREIQAEGATPSAFVIGEVDLSPENGRSSLRIDNQVPEELANYLMRHMMSHVAQHLVRQSRRVLLGERNSALS